MGSSMYRVGNSSSELLDNRRVWAKLDKKITTVKGRGSGLVGL